MRHFEVKKTTEVSDMLGDLEFGIDMYYDMGKKIANELVLDFIGKLIHFSDFNLEYDDCIDIDDEHNPFSYQGHMYDFVVEHLPGDGYFKGVLYELEHKFELTEIVEDDMPF